MVLLLREMVGAHQPSSVYLSIFIIFKIVVTIVITQLQKRFIWIQNGSVIVKFFKNQIEDSGLKISCIINNKSIFIFLVFVFLHVMVFPR